MRWVVAAAVASVMMVAGTVVVATIIRSARTEPHLANAPKADPPLPTQKIPAPRPIAAPTPKAEPSQRPESPKKERPSFGADWKAAQAIVAERRKGWEERAQRALRVLTVEEREAVGNAYFFAMTDPSQMADGDTALILARAGLKDAVRSISSEWAMKSAEFHALANRTWDHEGGAVAIADMAERWGIVRADRREYIVLAVDQNTPTADLPAPIRDLMLFIGLRKWLER